MNSELFVPYKNALRYKELRAVHRALVELSDEWPQLSLKSNKNVQIAC